MHVVLQVLKRQILQVYNSFVSPYLLFVPNKYQLQCGFNTEHTLPPSLSPSVLLIPQTLPPPLPSSTASYQTTKPHTYTKYIAPT